MRMGADHCISTFTLLLGKTSGKRKQNYHRGNRKIIRIDRYYLLAFIKSILVMGIIEKGGGEFWKILIWSIWHRPRLFPYAIMFTICGYHFRKLYGITES
jgi:hypothetical protein